MKIFNFVIVLLVMSLPSICWSETFLCLAEAGAGVTESKGGPLKAEIFNVSGEKYLFTNNSGKWILKNHGKNSVVYFDECESSFMCRCKKYYCGAFFRNKEGLFTYHKSVFLENGVGTDVIIKGYCSNI